MFGNEIVKKIQDYDSAYQSIGLKPPPYRITDIEHMVLENYLIWTFPESCKGKVGNIKEFMGIELEIVKKGDF